MSISELVLELLITLPPDNYLSFALTNEATNNTI